MRVLILNNLYPPHVVGGYEVACRNVALALRERGHDVRVLAGHAPVSTREDPEWVLRVFDIRRFSAVPVASTDVQRAIDYEASCSLFGNTAALLQNLREYKPDLVYCWFVWGIGGLALLDLVEQSGIPWVFHLMDAVPTYMLSGANALTTSLFVRSNASLLSQARIISMSRQILDEVQQTVGVRFERVSMVPGWVDTRGLKQRSRYMRGGRLRMVSAGSLGIHKGIDIIIESCARLVCEGRTNFELDVYGIGFAGEWQSLAARLGLNGYVRFHGPKAQSELLALLPEYDVFLFPTQEREPFGFVPVEAAACGCLPVLTRNAGASERLVEHVHALKIDRTIDSLSSALRELLSGSLDIEPMARRAARLVRSELSFEGCVDAIEQILQEELRPKETARLDDSRLPALLFAKHELGRYLSTRP